MADDTLVGAKLAFRLLELPEAFRSLCDWLLPTDDDRGVWRGSEPPPGLEGFSPVRHLLDAGIIQPDGPSDSIGEVFFCLWVSRPRDDTTSLHFVFEGVSDADISAIRAIELHIGQHSFEAPAERLSPKQTKAVWVAPIHQVLDSRRRAVNGPIRLRLITDA